MINVEMFYEKVIFHPETFFVLRAFNVIFLGNTLIVALTKRESFTKVFSRLFFTNLLIALAFVSLHLVLVFTGLFGGPQGFGSFIAGPQELLAYLFSVFFLWKKEVHPWLWFNLFIWYALAAIHGFFFFLLVSPIILA